MMQPNRHRTGYSSAATTTNHHSTYICLGISCSLCMSAHIRGSFEIASVRSVIPTTYDSYDTSTTITFLHHAALAPSL
ncbi:hypothetical protein CC78DRAFT_272957 [Lojkania enalia]|uniref:Uncharacterized protein n=1 Tax=Lojkania enalia TaxID=147567 RepID=A0A9P4K964_9PLEO|nr:hypothetical protein CC78DRAFT_272957 [Didymosphaeria enalia]